MTANDTSRISPTAHYTGYVWCRNGLSYPALETRTGKMLFHAINPAMKIARRLGAVGLEDMLLARHVSIDHLLKTAIERGDIGQVVEVAAGLSPRGCRMMQRYGDRLTYVEADLPGMSARKRARITSMGGKRPGHHVVDVDALLDVGARSLATVGKRLLQSDVGTAVITEGLVNYFSRAMVEGLWPRIARFLAQFPTGIYISDVHVTEDIERIPGARAFMLALSAFTRGNVHIHYRDARVLSDTLLTAGFAHATTRRPITWADTLSLSAPQARAPVHIIYAATSSR